MERVLITGARGRIGSVLRPALRSGLTELRLSRPDRPRRPGRARDLVPGRPGGLRRGPARGRGRRRRRAPRRGAGRGAVRGDRRPEPARHLPRLRGVPARGRASGSCSRAPTTRPACTRSASRWTRRVDAAARTASTARPRSGARRSGACSSTASGSSVVCLRIGSFRERPTEERELSTWLSHADGVRLVQAALTADVDFAIVYGASANTRRWWPADTLIGFAPEDDAEVFADGLPAVGLRAPGRPEHACATTAAGPRDHRRRAARPLRRAGRARDRHRGGALPARWRDARPAAACARGDRARRGRSALQARAARVAAGDRHAAVSGRGDRRRVAARRAPRSRARPRSRSAG